MNSISRNPFITALMLNCLFFFCNISPYSSSLWMPSFKFDLFFSNASYTWVGFSHKSYTELTTSVFVCFHLILLKQTWMLMCWTWCISIPYCHAAGRTTDITKKTLWYCFLCNQWWEFPKNVITSFSWFKPVYYF